MKEITIMLYLGAGALWDGKRKTVSFCYLWLGAALALSFLALEWSGGGLELSGLLWRLFPGTLFLLLAFLTKEKVGYGDGLVLCILGGCLPLSRLIGVWMVALILITLWAGGMLLAGKGSRHTKIPFLPFVWAANLLLWGFGYG